ncbi:MAG: CYTH domain-containing protein [Flavobacteriaceae bacterium]|nr:CYTH domain-containing protein [Flavobacteriaceae bacterium]
MGQEIERKFLVKNTSFKEEAFKKSKIVQGFLSTVPERTVRVRTIENKGFLTIKGIGNSTGVSRFEWEKEISITEANDLLKICEPGVIDKTRYFIKVGAHIFEVDVFDGENKGLIVAEIELSSEDELFTKPSWLAEEVTGQVKYYNASLKKKPFTKW